MHLAESWKQRHQAQTTIYPSSHLPRSLNRHSKRKVKTKRSGAATHADGESTNVIVPIPVALAKHEVKVMRVPGKKAKDRSKLFRPSFAIWRFL